MRVGISQVQYILGSNHTPVTELTWSSELHNIMHGNGLDRVYASNDRHIRDMLSELLCQFEDRPDYIILAHSLPYLFGSAEVPEPLQYIPFIDISGIPCCILHRGVQLAVSLVQKGIHQRVLAVGLDKCYADYERLFFGTAMSDIAIGLMIEAECPNNEILSSLINTTIIAANGVYSAPESVAAFRLKNPSFVRTAILECLKHAQVKPEDLDYIVCHTSNTKIWDQVSGLMRLPRDKFLDINIPKTGHMNSNDSFYHYFDYVRRGVIKAGQKVMLVNPGFGGSQGCTLILR